MFCSLPLRTLSLTSNLCPVECRERAIAVGIPRLPDWLRAWLGRHSFSQSRPVRGQDEPTVLVGMNCGHRDESVDHDDA